MRTPLTQVTWRNVRVGDIVMVRDDEEVPCDMLLLHAALPDNVCYIQTTNLGACTARQRFRVVMRAWRRRRRRAAAACYHAHISSPLRLRYDAQMARPT